MDSSNKSQNIEKLRDNIKFVLSEFKANDIMVFPISNKSNLADYMIIASGNSESHVKSLVKRLSEKIKDAGDLFIEGVEEGNWAVVSFQNIIVHIFRPEVREYYNLEDLWK